MSLYFLKRNKVRRKFFSSEFSLIWSQCFLSHPPDPSPPPAPFWIGAILLSSHTLKDQLIHRKRGSHFLLGNFFNGEVRKASAKVQEKRINEDNKRMVTHQIERKQYIPCRMARKIYDKETKRTVLATYSKLPEVVYMFRQMRSFYI